MDDGEGVRGREDGDEGEDADEDEEEEEGCSEV